MVSEQGYGDDAESGWSSGLHHVLLATPAGSEDALRTFHLDVFCMAEVATPPALAARGGLRVRADRSEVHLGVEADFRAARKAHPGIRVRGLDGLAAHLADPASPSSGTTTCSRATAAAPSRIRSATDRSSSSATPTSPPGELRN